MKVGTPAQNYFDSNVNLFESDPNSYMAISGTRSTKNKGMASASTSKGFEEIEEVVKRKDQNPEVKIRR